MTGARGGDTRPKRLLSSRPGPKPQQRPLSSTVSVACDHTVQTNRKDQPHDTGSSAARGPGSRHPHHPSAAPLSARRVCVPDATSAPTYLGRGPWVRVHRAVRGHRQPDNLSVRWRPVDPAAARSASARGGRALPQVPDLLAPNWRLTMTAWAYARVSTVDQDPAPQFDALRRAGVDEAHIVVDHASGSREDRPGLTRLLHDLHQRPVLPHATRQNPPRR